MHQLAIIIGRMMKNLGILCPMYCASCLMQKGNNVTRVRNVVRKAFADLEIVFDAPATLEAIMVQHVL
jgi:hypothetical protein